MVNKKKRVVKEVNKEKRLPYTREDVVVFSNETLVMGYRERVCLNHYSGNSVDEGHFCDEEVLEAELLRRLNR